MAFRAPLGEEGTQSTFHLLSNAFASGRGKKAGCSLTSVSREFPADTNVPLSGFEAVDGADVVETSAGHVVPRRGIGTGHDPGGPQGDGMDLGGGGKIKKMD